MAAREMKQEPKTESGGRGRGRKETSFLPHLLPALLLTPFFARSLTLVPRSLLLNRTETLATQAKPSIPCITGGEDADPPSRVSGAPRALRARLSSPDKRDKIAPVMQANFLKWPPKMQIITFRVREVIASKNRIAIVSPEGVRLDLDSPDDIQHSTTW